jgi:hypothetical protein
MKRRSYKYGRTLKDVRRELVKARMADGVAVHLTLKQPWRIILWWRSLQFIFKNRRRQKILKTMSEKSMGFDWRCSLPKKQQRAAGMLPGLNQ